jgi:hypothetical protein
MTDFLRPMNECPLNQMVVFFEQYGHPFVGWLDKNGRLDFDEDQYEAENHDGRASVELNVERRDLAGWMPLPATPSYNDWNRLVL